MAKLIAFDDQFGNHNPESSWRIAQLDISVARRSCRIVLHGYKDRASCDAGRDPIGHRTYTIPAGVFADLYARHLEPGGPNIMQLAYEFIRSVRDVPDPEFPDDPTRWRNFFDGGTDLL